MTEKTLVRAALVLALIACAIAALAKFDKSKIPAGAVVLVSGAVDAGVEAAIATTPTGHPLGLGVPIPTPGDAGTYLGSNGPGTLPTWSLPVPTPGATGTFLESDGGGTYWGTVVIPEAGAVAGWQAGMACNFTSAGSVTISANGFYSICGFSWAMQEFANANGNWTVSGSGLSATCNASGTHGRTDPTLSVRFQDVVPNWVETTPVRVTECWSSWSPGSSNGGIEVGVQNVWDAGACAWGAETELDFNHVSGNEALIGEQASARGCTVYPYNGSGTLVYSTAFGTGSACVRSTWAQGIQGPAIKEVVSGVTTPPSSGWQAYTYLAAGSYAFVSTTQGLGGSWTASTYSIPTWYSADVGLYCTGTNSAVFSYFEVEYKF
jgi:hypothetical protein